MKTFWIVVSALCGATAVFFVVRDDFEKMFIAAVLGAVAWFLSYRVRLSETLRDRDEMDREDEDDEEA
ncbi:MAG TPA: hypothetical protein VJP89_02545 [Pyrinomonadaceae bacterium]|nr:hypothetical protein [Pyrinomonadaceae bacterium]